MRVLSLVAALALAPASAQAAILFFDDFETGNTGGANRTPVGWSAIYGTVDLIGDSYFPEICRDPSNLEHCVDMDGSSGTAGHIRTDETFTLVSGGAYTLSFSYTKNYFQAQNDNVMDFGVGAFGTSMTYLGSEPVQDYRTMTYEFIGDGSSGWIFFQHFGSDLGGIVIDNVQLEGPLADIGGGGGAGGGLTPSDVPVPAALPLALAGVGALAALGRRRRAG